MNLDLYKSNLNFIKFKFSFKGGGKGGLFFPAQGRGTEDGGVGVHEADDAEILSVQKLYADEKNNVTFLLSEDRKTVKFDFDFLAKNEGFVVKVFHTAGEQRHPLQVKGALQNGLEFTLPNKRFSKVSAVLSHLRLPRTLLMKAEGYFTLLMGLSIIQMAFSDDKMRHLHEPFETIMMTLVGCSMLLMSYMLLYRRLPQKLHKAYYDEY